MPSRIETLRLALPAILAQVERLYLYLDKYAEIPPELLDVPKLFCLLPQQGSRSLGAAGKFQALTLHPEPCLFFGFDDDILYGASYVQHLATALGRHSFRALVGLHGAVYRLPLTSYVKDRRVLHFRHAIDFDAVVDELGTGTVAFHSSAIDIEPMRWTDPNMTDLLLMIDAVRQETPRICVRRPKDLARALAEGQEDSLFIKSVRDDSAETRLLQQAMRHYPVRWSMSS